MFHPFSSEFKQLCDFESNTSNYAIHDKSGKDRKLQEVVLRLPLIWIVAPILLAYWGRSIYLHPKTWMIAAITTIGVVAAIIGLYFLSCRIKFRSKSVNLYYEQVPVARPKKQRVPVKVRWLDAKGKLCLPFPE
jgi:hypothetical protein